MAILRAVVDAAEYTQGECTNDLLVDALTRNPWLGVYFRVVYDRNRKYRLRSWYLEDYKPSRKKGDPKSLFNLLTELQFNKLNPEEAAFDWWNMLQSFDQELHPTLNMILDRKLGTLTRKECNRAMKQTKNFPLIEEAEQ